jgi:hypothetical protein
MPHTDSRPVGLRQLVPAARSAQLTRGTSGSDAIFVGTRAAGRGQRPAIISLSQGSGNER